MFVYKETVLEAYRFRHACKEFDPARQISEDDFAFILETGRLSPSSYGFEPWKFVVLQNPEIREKLRAHTWGAQKTLPTASHFVLIFARNAGEMLDDSDYVQSIMTDVQKLPPEAAANKQRVYRKFLESDFALLGRDGAIDDWTAKQTYIALGNMMTSAALVGIDSCPIEGFEREPIERILREEGINDGSRFNLACMVAFGYRVREPRDKTRRELSEVVEWR